MSDALFRVGNHLLSTLPREPFPSQSAAADANNKDRRKIHQAALDFESILLGHWLEQAEQSFGSVPGEDEEDGDDPGKSDFQAIGMQSLAGAITRSGGIGLARLLENKMLNTSSPK